VLPVVRIVSTINLTSSRGARRLPRKDIQLVAPRREAKTFAKSFGADLGSSPPGGPHSNVRGGIEDVVARVGLDHEGPDQDMPAGHRAPAVRDGDPTYRGPFYPISNPAPPGQSSATGARLFSRCEGAVNRST
jgi:hypothetical protein